MKKAVTLFLSLLLLLILASGITGYRIIAGKQKGKAEKETWTYEKYYEPEMTNSQSERYIQQGQSLRKLSVETDASNYRVLVNREYPMDEDFMPSGLVIPNVDFVYYGDKEILHMEVYAAAALETMFAAAEKKDIILKAVSGYRSYESQKKIYEGNVDEKGQESTDLVSAEPGTSEHQTGLAIDVTGYFTGSMLEENFADSKEGQWLAKHCYEYGYIIRYPEDKTEITGYSYEPWHIRYVGKELASYLHEKDWTLEEYYRNTLESEAVPLDERDAKQEARAWALLQDAERTDTSGYYKERTVG